MITIRLSLVKEHRKLAQYEPIDTLPTQAVVPSLYVRMSELPKPLPQVLVLTITPER